MDCFDLAMTAGRVRHCEQSEALQTFLRPLGKRSKILEYARSKVKAFSRSYQQIIRGKVKILLLNLDILLGLP